MKLRRRIWLIARNLAWTFGIARYPGFIGKAKMGDRSVCYVEPVRVTLLTGISNRQDHQSNIQRLATKQAIKRLYQQLSESWIEASEGELDIPDDSSFLKCHSPCNGREMVSAMVIWYGKV